MLRRRCGARGRGDSETAVANSSAALVAFVAAVSRGWAVGWGGALLGAPVLCGFCALRAIGFWTRWNGESRNTWIRDYGFGV